MKVSIPAAAEEFCGIRSNDSQECCGKFVLNLEKSDPILPGEVRPNTRLNPGEKLKSEEFVGGVVKSRQMH